MAYATEQIETDGRLAVHALAFGAFLLASIPALQSTAQTLDDLGSVETLIGTEVDTGNIADVSTDNVIAALNGIVETTERVKMMYKFDAFEIIFLGGDNSLTESNRLADGITEHKNEIDGLRAAMESSALFYLALDEKNIDVDRIVAADITDGEVTVYVTGDQ